MSEEVDGVRQERMHASCVALDGIAAALTGPSGSGKSDLALRFVMAHFANDPLHVRTHLDSPGTTSLVADDQILIERYGERLVVHPPKTLAGKIEIRGLGIMQCTHLPNAELKLIVRLTEHDKVPRLPQDPPLTQTLLGVQVRTIELAPYDASAPNKLYLALKHLI